MHTFLRHQYEILQMDLKRVDCQMQQLTWLEINDDAAVKHYQDAINTWAYKKEHYLNNLLKSLAKTEITLENVAEIKSCYELIEVHSKQHSSNLFKVHLYKVIEKYHKKHSDFLMSNQLKKAVETEHLIYDLEQKY